MSRFLTWFLGGALVIIVIIAISALLLPQNNPAFDNAVRFVQAAGSGDNEAAFALLTPEMQTYVQANCPQGIVSTCIDAFTPPQWGDFQSVVFRRAAPDGEHWDVQLIATYQYEEGFSGVCIYLRMEQNLVAGWAGFVHCGDPASREMENNPQAPNRAP